MALLCARATPASTAVYSQIGSTAELLYNPVTCSNLPVHVRDNDLVVLKLQDSQFIVVIITWPREKPSEKNKSDITVIWFCNWFKWANLSKISTLMSQFSTNK